MRDELDITKNIRLTGYLEADILSSTSELYKRIALNSDSRDVAEAIADIIIKAYILSDVLGIGYANVDMKIKELLKKNNLESFNIDLKGLLRHIGASREKTGA